MDDPRDSSSPFGVLDFLSWTHEKFNHHYTQDQTRKSLALMREAGVAFVRFDFLWEDIEPQAGHFVFDKYDRLVTETTAEGIKILAVLGYTPSWSGKSWNQAPDPEAYGRFSQAMVHRYKDRVRHWQIWQEPDSPAFWQPQNQMRQYVKLLQHVYPLLKAEDPTSIIHIGGMSRSLPISLRNVYENGGKDAFDIVDIHPFANPLTPQALEGLRFWHQAVYRVLAHYGDQAKPVWFTEIGSPGMRDPQAAPHWWLGKNPDEQTQAAWVKTVYDEMLHWKGVEKIFWCFFRDTQRHFKSGSDFDGLIRHDFSKKPSFEAYREAVQRHEALLEQTKNPPSYPGAPGIESGFPPPAKTV